MWSYRFYDHFRPPSLHFPFRSSILYPLVLACAAHKMLMTKSSECVRQTNFFFLSFLFVFDLFRTPIRKDPEINSRGKLISFYAELSLSLPVPASYCIYFMLVLPVFNAVDNGQFNLGKRIRGVRPMNPKSFDHYAGNATVSKYRIF